VARHPGPVLVDTNVIIEAHRIGAWKALTGGHSVETVADCVTETQTGYRRRRREQLIDRVELLASMAVMHEVSDREIAVLAVKTPDIFSLDERSCTPSTKRVRR